MQTQQINRLEWQISVSTHSLSHTHRHGLKRIAKDKQPDNNNNNSKDREKNWYGCARVVAIVHMDFDECLHIEWERESKQLEIISIKLTIIPNIKEPHKPL